MREISDRDAALMNVFQIGEASNRLSEEWQGNTEYHSLA